MNSRYYKELNKINMETNLVINKIRCKPSPDFVTVYLRSIKMCVCALNSHDVENENIREVKKRQNFRER